jgi:hypothetical protein
MTWNYRVVRHKTADEGTYYQIHEVYYDDDGKVISMTEKGIAPLGETTTELQLELNRMLDCMSKPVLDYGVTDGKPEDWHNDSEATDN